MDYNFREIEQKAIEKWKAENVYKVEYPSTKPKFYVLDMFPYPSGAGLHVGHPLGYIASDIFSRYKKLKGFNVLHPMGFDSFGLPAEQYAIQTGQHPAKTTVDNIKRYKEQLSKIGFSFDWEREVSTADASYYKWTQWIFCQLFEHWYDKTADKAKEIKELIAIFEQEGNLNVVAACGDNTNKFTAPEWTSFSEMEKSDMLMQYRLAYQADSWVNWCEGLGTVLANDEVKDGFSERGGFPVEKKKMSQWFLRITAYAQRLLTGLETLDWSDSMKEMQRNWIGKSIGAMVKFEIKSHSGFVEVFTTRIDTIFGVSFMVIAPEHELVDLISTAEYKEEIKAYQKYCNTRTDTDRQSDVKNVTGQFLGAYAINPFNGVEVPIFIADYVLIGYGTGAVMAVPSGDQRDFLFAKKFNLPIIPILDTQITIETEANPTKEGKYINSDFIDGLEFKAATNKLIEALEIKKIGYGKVNFRMRDAGFSRQRYWGEPFPIFYENGIPKLLELKDLPLELPEVISYKPAGSGESPLSTATKWVNELGDGKTRETDTMPAFAGSSWYFLRYMDAQNDNEFVSRAAQQYWQDVDLYIGGTEHAVGHLLYSRFWHKFFYDKGLVSTEEPFKKLVNQGMIQGRSLLTKENQIKGISGGLNVPINLADNKDRLFKDKLVYLSKNDNRFENIDVEKDVNWEENENGQFILLQNEVEKMSKSKYNVVNPDDIINEFGADCFRMFEMFLGPIEQHKPWDTQGIGGVSRFIGKLWRLFNFDENGNAHFSTTKGDDEAYKILHKTIKKVTEDIERFSFNTAVSAFMICVNDLSKFKLQDKNILSDLVLLMAPFGPFTTEFLWEKLGNDVCILKQGNWPIFNESFLVENLINYPISFNGKVRAKLDLDAALSENEIEKIVLENENVIKILDGKAPKKVIVVKGRIVNVVI